MVYFPQLRGLGYTEYSQYYGIENLLEAKEYLDIPILKHRLIEISKVLYDLNADNIIEVFGCIDSLKVQACMTLFSMVSDEEIFENVLKRYYGGEIHEETIKLLKEQNKD